MKNLAYTNKEIFLSCCVTLLPWILGGLLGGFAGTNILRAKDRSVIYIASFALIVIGVIQATRDFLNKRCCNKDMGVCNSKVCETTTCK